MMQEANHSTTELPGDLAACHALIREQASEMEKLRELLHRLVNGSRSEKRILSGSNQQWLPFESPEEFEAAKAEAEAEAKQIIEKYEVQRHVRKKKRRDESLPADLPRVEVPVEVDESLRQCPTHGSRKQIGEDVVETLVIEPPKAFVEVRRYPKFVCDADKHCGVTSPQRPTGLVEGNRYGPSVAAAIIDYKWGHYLPIYRHQDLFAACGWTPRRSTLLNLVQAADFVIEPLVALMTRRVQQDVGVGIDDTSCRMLMPAVDPPVDPSNLKSVRLAEKLAKREQRETRACMPRCGFTRGCITHPIISSTFESRATEMDQMSSSGTVTVKYKAIAFRATPVWPSSPRTMLLQ
jgi:transposase